MFRTAALLMAGCAAGLSQGQDPAVIRINVNLVQVDAVVTNSKHEHITNLKAEDFELLQDGKPQKITNFSYVSLPHAAPPVLAIASKGLPGTTPTTVTMPMKPSDARRMIALVVDDLGLSFADIGHVRDALRKFVDHEMQPGDMVAIVRTSSGMGVLQQFTTDRTLLHAAIDKVKFTLGRLRVDSFELEDREISAGDPHKAAAEASNIEIEAIRQPMFLSGTLGAIEYVMSGLRDLPGRKSLVLFSESMNMSPQGLRSLIDNANRASVVIYTIDPRGIPPFGFSAAEDVGPVSKDGPKVIGERKTLLLNSRQGLAALAEETGGLFLHDDNFVDDALHRAVTDTEGYYLLGYHPDTSTFDSKTGRLKFHQLRVGLKVAGLAVRSRMGFIGEPDQEVSDAPHTPKAQMLDALTSPFSSGSIHVRLTSLFNQTHDARSCISALLYIDAKDLKFTEQPGGERRTTMEVAAMTFGEAGKPADQSDRTFTLTLQPEQYSAALENGLIYSVNQPVQRPGPYQIRVALRDANSEQLGSASQFLEIPDLRKGYLALSSILLREDTKTGASDMSQAEGRLSEPDPSRSAAVRIFKPGSALAYEYLIFNFCTNSSQKTELAVETRLFHEGRQIYTGQPMIPNLGAKRGPHSYDAGGHLTLAAGIAPGDYVLQMIVQDKLAGAKHQYASQWVDFEVQK